MLWLFAANKVVYIKHRQNITWTLAERASIIRSSADTDKPARSDIEVSQGHQIWYHSLDTLGMVSY